METVTKKLTAPLFKDLTVSSDIYMECELIDNNLSTLEEISDALEHITLSSVDVPALLLNTKGLNIEPFIKLLLHLSDLDGEIFLYFKADEHMGSRSKVKFTAESGVDYYKLRPELVKEMVNSDYSNISVIWDNALNSTGVAEDAIWVEDGNSLNTKIKNIYRHNSDYLPLSENIMVTSVRFTMKIIPKMGKMAQNTYGKSYLY